MTTVDKHNDGEQATAKASSSSTAEQEVEAEEEGEGEGREEGRKRVSFSTLMTDCDLLV